MSKTTMETTELSRRYLEAQSRANRAPVFLTSQGKETHVLMSAAEYKAMLSL